jgi:hypothetical protein
MRQDAPPGAHDQPRSFTLDGARSVARVPDIVRTLRGCDHPAIAPASP